MKITWNLRMLCAEKGIWTGAELGRQLRDKFGLELSAQTLSNLLTRTPKAPSLNMVLALCVALECTPNDLLLVDTRPTQRSARKLVDEITRVNLVRAPRNVRGGRKKRRTAGPPKTGI